MTDQEINELVARKLGLVDRYEKWLAKQKAEEPKDQGLITYGPLVIPDFCHSIVAAWLIVEALKNYWIKLERKDDQWIFLVAHDMPVVAKSDTAPMAICLAFLEVK